jgi:putative endonuclease
MLRFCSGEFMLTGMAFYCYIVASGRNGTLYIGSTDNLTVRIGQHKDKTFDGFTAKYGCNQLVWLEVFDTRDAAFKRERRMKEWRRSWKLMAIEAENPEWEDLYWETCGILRPGDELKILGLLPMGGDRAAGAGG